MAQSSVANLRSFCCMPRHGNPESILPFDGNLSPALPAVQTARQSPALLSRSLATEVKHTPTPGHAPHPTAAFQEVSHCVEARRATRGKVPAPPDPS
uniref:Uncharacterized protein n=1 Tax=Setaria italica TaxID=4555 RepID=K3XNL4_SETIT